MFFAIWIYSKNTATKLAGLAVGFLVVGPNILLLLPVWLLGVGCYHCLHLFPSSRVLRFQPSVAFWKGLFAVSSAATLLQICLPIPNPLEARFPFGKAPLFYAGHFMADFINGCSVAISILSFNKGFASAHWPKGLVSPIKAIAERSFSLYLFHFPLLVFAKACFPTVPVNSIGMILLTCAVFAATWLLASFTEAKRAWWKSKFSQLL